MRPYWGMAALFTKNSSSNENPAVRDGRSKADSENEGAFQDKDLEHSGVWRT